MLATKVKLAVGNAPTVITVSECVEVEGNYGPQARITGHEDHNPGGPITIYEKLDSVTRQLGRIGLNVESAVGECLAFWKETASNAAGQTFPALRIDIVKDEPAAAPKPVAAKPAARTAQPTALGGPLPYEQQETGAPPAKMPLHREAEAANREARVAAQFALYSKCLDKALQEVIRTGLDKLGGDVAGAVVASAATLFIQANKS